MFSQRQVRIIKKDDFEKYMRRCFFEIRNPLNGIWEFVKFEDLKEGEFLVSFDDDKNNLLRIPQRELEINTRFPQSGFWFDGQQAFLYTQKTVRTTLKGISPASHELRRLASMVLGDLDNVEHSRFLELPKLCEDPFSAETLTNLFSRVFPQNTLDQVFERRVPSVALSRFFGLAAGYDGENPSLWFLSMCVGEMPDPQTILVDCPEAHQEVLDFANPRGINVRLIA